MNEANKSPDNFESNIKVFDSTARKWGMLCHLTALSGFIIPFGNIIGPLVIWLLKKDDIPFVDEQGKASLNFQISMMLWVGIGVLLCFVVIGFLILPVLGVLEIIFIIIASIKAYEGKTFNYPLTIKFIK